MTIYNYPYSPSSVSRYLECPYSFFLRYIKKIKLPSGDAANFGKAIHKVNEMFWANYKIYSEPLKAMQYTIDEYWDKTIKEEYEQPAHQCMDNFIAIVNENPTIFPTYTEVKASNNINDTVAIIDVVYPHKLVDYKTSTQFTIKPKLPNIIQAVMCSHNLNVAFGLDIRRVEFQYLRMKKYQVVDVTDTLIDEINLLIEQVRNKVKNDEFPKKDKCFICEYKLICESEKRYKEKICKVEILSDINKLNNLV